MAEIRVEVTTHIIAANGDAQTYSVARSCSVTDNPLFWENEADEALVRVVEAQRDNLTGRWRSAGPSMVDTPS